MSNRKNKEISEFTSAVKLPVKAGDLAGVSALVYENGKVIHFSAEGMRNREKELPMQRDTIVRIASMTKPISSVAMMMLIEEGKAALSDSICNWAPEFSQMRVLTDAQGTLSDTTLAPRNITIEDLMTHRSGLGYAFTSKGPIGKAYDESLGDPLYGHLPEDEWMGALAKLPLCFAPGERFHYSHSTDVLGFLIGRISGMGFRDFLIERIFEPLKMDDTDFFVPIEKRNRVAEVYSIDRETGNLEHSIVPNPPEPPAYCSGGGGLFSTIDDFLIFSKMMLERGRYDGGTLLQPDSIKLMTTNRLTDSQRDEPFLGMPFWLGSGFGLGLEVVTNEAEHAIKGGGSVGAFTWMGAYGTSFVVDPEKDMIIIYFTQNAANLDSDFAENGLDETAMRIMGHSALFSASVYEKLAELGKD